jgi:hypothetical protein
MPHAHIGKGVPGKLPLAAFDFLQTQNVRLCERNEPRHEPDPQPDRVDIPRSDAHAQACAWKCGPWLGLASKPHTRRT